MNRTELIRNITDYLRDRNIRKPLAAQKHSFFISDEYENTKEFVVKETAKKLLYNRTDVENIIDACLEIIKDSIQHGEAVTIHGFGTFGLNYRKPRKTRLVGTDIDVDVPGRYVPKFNFGNELRMCARVYELALGDGRLVRDIIDDDVESDGEAVEI